MYIRILTLAIFTILFSFAAFGQAPAATRIAVVNSYDFSDEKAGLTKYVNALKTLNTEFLPAQTEINTMNTRLQTLTREIEASRNAAGTNQATIQTKIDEGQRLERDVKRKAEDAKIRYERRQKEMLAPVLEAVGKSLQDFAKQKGYSLIFDISKDQNGLLIAIGDQGVDVTKDFIAFHNAKP